MSWRRIITRGKPIEPVRPIFRTFLRVMAADGYGEKNAAVLHDIIEDEPVGADGLLRVCGFEEAAERAEQAV